MKILNAVPELGKPLTEQQIRGFLEKSKLNLQLGTQIITSKSQKK